MTSWVITVTKTAAGGLTYTAAPGNIDASQLQVNPGDKVSWKGSNGHIIVYFKANDSPITPKQFILSADKGKKTTPPSKIRTLTATEHPRPPFRYAVGHIDMTETLLIDDPDLIINDPGGGGPVPLAKQPKLKVKILRKPAR